MKKLRLFIGLLFTACSLSALSGCNSNKALPDFVMPDGGYNDSEVTVRFYHTMSQDLQDVLNIYIDEFNEEYPKITIESLAIGGYDDVRDQLKTELSIGEQANIAYCYPDHVALYNKAKSVVTIDTLMDDPTIGLSQAQKDDFVDAYYEEGKQFGDDKLYCLPFSKSTEVLYYDKTFFEKHNLTVPTTWDEMESVCKTIKEIDPDSIPLGYDSDSNLFITMCEQLDSPYTSSTKPNFLFDNAENRAFVEKFKGWYQKGYFTTKGLYGSYTSGLFTSTEKVRSYMCVGSSAGASYQRPAMINSKYPFEVGITSIPQADKVNHPAVISQGPSVCIFKSKNDQAVIASWLFVKYLLTSVDFQAEFSMKSGYVPVLESVFENTLYKNFLNSANGTDNIQALSAKVCVEQKDYYYASPAFVGSATARDEVGSLVSAILSESKTTDAAFKDALSACNYQVD